MKKFLLIVLMLSIVPVFAITWERLESPTGHVGYLDIDSITVEDGYYFYNIKHRAPDRKKYSVVTIQSSHSHPFSARIKVYSEAEYDSLNGNYENITANKTDKLEPVPYTSIANTCYKRVKGIIERQKNSDSISF